MFHKLIKSNMAGWQVGCVGQGRVCYQWSYYPSSFKLTENKDKVSGYAYIWKTWADNILAHSPEGFFKTWLHENIADTKGYPYMSQNQKVRMLNFGYFVREGDN